MAQFQTSTVQAVTPLNQNFPPTDSQHYNIQSSGQLEEQSRTFVRPSTVNLHNDYREVYHNPLTNSGVVQSSSHLSNRNSKYSNKYSFKRQVGQSVRVNQIYNVDKELREITYAQTKSTFTSSFEQQVFMLRTTIRQQELLLAKIRDIALNRKLVCEKEAILDKKCINALIEIYNLSITNTHLTQLQFLEEIIITSRPITVMPPLPPPTIITNRIPPPPPIITRPPPPIITRPVPPPITPRPINIISITPSKPIYVPPPPPPIKIPTPPVVVPYIPPRPKPEPIVVPKLPEPLPPKPQPIYVPPPTDRTKQLQQKIIMLNIKIQQLNIRIQQLMSEKTKLVENIHYYELKISQTSYNEEQINIYLTQIQSLKFEITQLNLQISNSKSSHTTIEQELRQQINIYINREQEIEEQLIIAQKHITYLEGIANKPAPPPVTVTVTVPDPSLQIEITQLRETIAKYTEHIEQIQTQKKQIVGYLEKAENFIVQLQSQNNLDISQITILQQTIQQYELEIQRITNINIQLTQQITHLEIQINQYTTTIHNLQNKPVPVIPTGPNQGAYDALVIENGKRLLQTIILMEEIYRLNVIYQQFKQHISQAEEHIRKTQVYISELELSVKTFSYKDGEIETLKLKIKDYDNKIIYLNQQIALFQTKQAQHNAQLQKVQTKFKTIITQLDTSYTELQQEKAVLIAAKDSNQDLILLQEQNKKLIFELNELAVHLETAENFIKQNTELWEKTRKSHELMPQKLAIIDMLKKDLELSRKQNKELNERILQLEGLIEMMERRSEQTETVIVKQDDSHYTNIIRELEHRLGETERQNQAMIVDLQKFSKVESSIRMTQQISSENETRWQNQRRNFQTENLQLKNHLLGAEQYIKELELQLEKVNLKYNQFESEHKVTMKESQTHTTHTIHTSLKEAEQHIFQMEKLIPAKITR